MNLNSIKYPFITRLNKSIKNVKREMLNLKKINICCYRINNTIESHFLEYLLFKYNDEMVFPWINFNAKEETGNPINIGTTFLKNVFKKIDANFKFKGYLYDNETLFLFYNIKLQLDFNLITNDDMFIFTTIYEIINQKQFLYFNIEEGVYKFFIENSDSIYLYKNDNVIEIPAVFYNGSESKKAQYYSVLGINKYDLTSVFGPNYYFTNMIGSIKWSGWLNNDKIIKELDTSIIDKKSGKYRKGTILRFAVFLGIVSIKPNNEKDESIITKNLSIEKKNTHSVYESDRDSTWINNYDSILLNKTKTNDNLIIGIQNLDNIKLLSYHNLDMKSTPLKYNKYITSLKIL